jgi:hypothetical protein
MVAVLVHPPECSPHMLSLCLLFFFLVLDSACLVTGLLFDNPLYFNDTFAGPAQLVHPRWLADAKIALT